jgi:hypothetical protein
MGQVVRLSDRYRSLRRERLELRPPEPSGRKSWESLWEALTVSIFIFGVLGLVCWCRFCGSRCQPGGRSGIRLVR